MHNTKLTTWLFLFSIVLSFAGCTQKDDIFEKFPPEILYKRYEFGSGGSGSWIASPDAVEAVLEAGETEWIIRARVSAPNELADVRLVKVSAGEELLETYTDFTLHPTVLEIEYTLTGITSDTVIRLKAVDKKKKVTQRDFVIKVP